MVIKNKPLEKHWFSPSIKINNTIFVCVFCAKVISVCVCVYYCWYACSPGAGRTQFQGPEREKQERSGFWAAVSEVQVEGGGATNPVNKAINWRDKAHMWLSDWKVAVETRNRAVQLSEPSSDSLPFRLNVRSSPIRYVREGQRVDVKEPSAGRLVAILRVSVLSPAPPLRKTDF